MTDTSPILLEDFITVHTKVIRNNNVLLDTDLSVLFEAEVDIIQNLIQTNLHKFKEDNLIILSVEETEKFNNVRYALTDSGIFILAGLIKSKRAIKIYVKMVEVLVRRLQNRAYELATSTSPNKN